jgi:hypothetical protein
LNHDEHQFVAPSVLLLREGLLPYRDYPFFHTPNLVFVFAPLFAASFKRALRGCAPFAGFRHRCP